MWVAPEIKDPVIFQEPTHKKISLFGSVNSVNGQFVYEFSPIFNAETFLEHLKQILLYRPKNKKILLILDNDRYHHALFIQPWLEKNKRLIELLFLPPYSPELNPTELIWKRTRYKTTHNRYFPTIDCLCDALEIQFQQWTLPNEELLSLCAINYVA